MTISIQVSIESTMYRASSKNRGFSSGHSHDFPDPDILHSIISSYMEGPAMFADGCTENVHNGFSPIVVRTRSAARQQARQAHAWGPRPLSL